MGAYPTYCLMHDVYDRLNTGLSGVTLPNVPGRDALVTARIESISRQFDLETGRNFGNFAPVYDTRVYPGKGMQELSIDEAASIVKVEFNSVVAGTPNWVDITSDFATQRMVLKPIRYYPKNRVFRQYTFITDPYETGNYRFTGIWGFVQPDLTSPPPTGQSPTWSGLSDPQIQALAPNSAGPVYGWWTTPPEVVQAVADWCVYSYRSGQAAYSDTGGESRSATLPYNKGMPPHIRNIIQKYQGAKSRLALISLDGTDAVEDQATGQGSLEGRFKRRWAGWQTVP